MGTYLELADEIERTAEPIGQVPVAKGVTIENPEALIARLRLSAGAIKDLLSLVSELADAMGPFAGEPSQSLSFAKVNIRARHIEAARTVLQKAREALGADETVVARPVAGRAE